jgi:hypothetical protein
MYGNFITDNGNGTFSVTGGQRKYGELDQYLMGLRAPTEVSPIMALDDGSHHGSPAGAHPNDGTSDTVMGMTRVDVSIDDIVRALGPRSPAYPNTQSCWRVAFVLVVPPGETYKPADVAKVDAYRRRFQDWFNWATDGRGTMDARLNGSGCIAYATPDAGTVLPPVDAGALDTDAGTVMADAGVPMETVDAGPIDDTPMTPMNMPPVAQMPDDIAKLKPRCGCTSVEGTVLLAALALLRRRRR